MKTHSILKAILMSLMLACSISAFADGNDSIPPTPINPSDGKDVQYDNPEHKGTKDTNYNWYLKIIQYNKPQ